MSKTIPQYDNYKLIGRTRLDAAIALANSNPILLARDLVDGLSIVHKFGAASSIGTALKPVTTSQTYKTPTTATALELVSDSTDDNGSSSPLGSGALTVRVFGLQTWAGETTEDITLNGTTAVALSNTWLRIYRMKVITSGTYANDSAPSHNSTISLQETGGGAVWGQMDAQSSFGLGQSEIAAYSVPTGKLAYILGAHIFVESSKAANVLLYVRDGADTVVTPYSVMQSKLILRSVNDSVHFAPAAPMGAFVGPCDLGWMAASTLGTTSVSVDFELIIADA